MAVLKVDADLCVGCGLCAELCPLVFEMRESKAWIIARKIPVIHETLAVVKSPNACDSCDCILSIDSCPVAAISLVKD
jgi:ferredoxin